MTLRAGFITGYKRIVRERGNKIAGVFGRLY
jgi:hypothetical protein